MAAKAQRMVALLRGINVGGNRKVPMPVLVELATAEGFTEVRHYINSGNLVFSAGGAPAVVEAKLQAAIEKRFGFFVDVVVRTAAQWEAYAKARPFPQSQVDRPHLVQLGLSKRPPLPGAVEALEERATAGERLKLVGDGLWIDYPAGIARTRLTPAAVDKAVGSTVTARNWKTVCALAALLTPAD
jgi:uncharacterized protein (DUF1697 family)